MAQDFETRLFINNEFVESQSGEKLTITNPYDGSIITTSVHVAGQQEVNTAVAAARNAQSSWRRSTAPKRSELLVKLAELLRTHASRLAMLETRSMGQPLPFTTYQLHVAADALKYYAGWTDKIKGEVQSPTFSHDGGTRIVYYEPLGVCAGIVPWNASFALTAIKLGAAVAAGNTFILKSSEKSPLALLAWGKLVCQAGFPPGVIQILSGDGGTGQLLAEHMDVDKVSFTGSVATGRAVQTAAAKSNLKRVTLELGGKSAALVFEDADIESALSAMSDQFLFNSGQLCVATSRLLVQESIAETFKEKLKARFTKAEAGYGDPAEMTTMFGPLVDQKQFDRVMGFLNNSEGDVVTGGGRWGDKGFFVQPTLLTNLDTSSTIWKDEIFGPVLAMRTFKTEEEALTLANDTTYGLSAAVFTKDSARAIRVSQGLEAGSVGLNQLAGFDLTNPSGGFKMSGHGRENGKEGLMEYLQTKLVATNTV